jgi:hypothetical protein
MSVFIDRKTNLSVAGVHGLDQIERAGIRRGECVIGANGLLAVYGLRANHDLDLIVLPEKWEKLRDGGKFEEGRMPSGSRVLRLGDLEVFDNNYPLAVDTRDLLADRSGALMIRVGGFNFYSLALLAEWKRKMGRPKDLADLKLMESLGRK